MTSVAQVGSLRLGRQVSPRYRTGLFPTKYLRLANITVGGLDLSDVQEMDFTPEEREIYALQHGDIVIADSSGSKEHVGRAAIWREQIQCCCYQNHLIRFRPHAADPDFALLAFRHMAVAGIFAQVARGVGIQHLGVSRLAALPFRLPPLAEQRRIAKAYGERIDHLEATQKALSSALATINLQNKEILAAAISGDLVAGIESNISARTPPITRRKQSRVRQSSLFEETVKPLASDGELPAGWRYVTVQNAGDVTIGKQLSREAEQGSRLHNYLRVANIMDNDVAVSDVKKMHFTQKEADTYKLEIGDILLTEGGSVTGRAAMYRGQPRDACFQNSLIRFRALEGVNPEYALLVFRHYFHAGMFERISRGVGIQHLSLKRFIEMPFPLPPEADQLAIVKRANHRLQASTEQESAIRSSLAKLPALERELLDAALSGSLAEQDNDEQSALDLLSEIGPPPTISPKQLQTHTRAAPMAKPRKSAQSSTPVADLSRILREAGRPLSVPELFNRAGYNRDSVEHVEQFYIALRSEIGHSIRKAGSLNENAMLETLADAS